VFDDISLIYNDKNLHMKEEKRWKSVEEETADPLLAPLSFSECLLFLPLFSSKRKRCNYMEELQLL
jgi:hypothetical protein